MPGFSLAAYGCATFTELLEACAASGTLRFGERAEDRWFVFNSAAHFPDDDLGGSARIVKAVWDVCVDVDSAGAWFDLREDTIETDPAAVEDEPERFIKLPHFDHSRQAVLLREFSEHVEGADSSAIASLAEEWSSTRSAYSRLLKVLQEHGLDRRWLTHLREAVKQALRVWTGEHGVSPSTIFERPRDSSRTSGRRASRSLVDELDELELRTFLKSAIDSMTLAELSQWSVPVRLLLKSR